MIFYIYSRKSVFSDRSDSVENQVEMCRQYLLSRFPDTHQASLRVYEDEGFSAKDTQRPQFLQMLADMRRQPPDYLVCYRLDRISRSVSDFSTLIEELNRRNIAFLCIREEFDTAKPMGKAMMYIASVFAQLERETIAQRVRDNMLMLARTGRWLGGTTPTGYSSERWSEVIVDGRSKTACRLRDNPQELYTVDIIFAKYLELHSLAGVQRHLRRQGLYSRTGKDFSLPGLKELLQNPVYCIADRAVRDYFVERGAEVCFEEKDCIRQRGLLAYNKRDYRRQQATRQPVDRWIVAVGKHRGRVTGDQWVRVQQLLEQSVPTGKRPAKLHNDYALLSGLIYCQRCGGRMFAKHRSGSDHYDYICQRKLRGGCGGCDCGNLGGQATDALVLQSLLPHLRESPSTVEALEARRRALLAQAQPSPLAILTQRIQQKNQALDGLVTALSQGGSIGLTQRLADRAALLEAERRQLEQQYQQLQHQASESTTVLESLADALLDLGRCLPQLALQEQRRLVGLLTRRLVWDGQQLHLFLQHPL